MEALASKIEMERTMTITEALQEVMKTDSSKGFNGYAQTYADAALRMSMTGTMLKTQIAYILSNLGQWRGETAREAKKVLNAALKD